MAPRAQNAESNAAFWDLSIDVCKECGVKDAKVFDL